MIRALIAVVGVVTGILAFMFFFTPFTLAKLPVPSGTWLVWLATVSLTTVVGTLISAYRNQLGSVAIFAGVVGGMRVFALSGLVASPAATYHNGAGVLCTILTIALFVLATSKKRMTDLGNVKIVAHGGGR